ncbi:hypothetical protein ABKV19_026418 [Rosa sericea]
MLPIQWRGHSCEFLSVRAKFVQNFDSTQMVSLLCSRKARVLAGQGTGVIVHTNTGDDNNCTSGDDNNITSIAVVTKASLMECTLDSRLLVYVCMAFNGGALEESIVALAGIEDGEEPKSAAVRELQEEIGVAKRLELVRMTSIVIS